MEGWDKASPKPFSSRSAAAEYPASVENSYFVMTILLRQWKEGYRLWRGRKMGTGKHKNIYGENWAESKERSRISWDPLPLWGCNPHKWTRTGTCSKELIFINSPRMPFSWCIAWFKGFPEKQHTINQRATLIGSRVILKTAIPFCGLITGN